MHHQQGLDPTAILTALGVAGASDITPVSGGFDTAIWRVAHGQHIYALRVFRAEQVATCKREIAAMRAAKAAGLPVPPIHAVGSWHDRPALLLGWCEGAALLRVLGRQPWRTWALGVAFGRMQAAIHAIALEPGSELEHGAWITWAGADERALQERLRAIASNQHRLLHLDYHSLNVMSDGRRITGVLDWANARLGDPRADLARTYTILAIDPSWPHGPHVRAFRWVLARAWQHGYEQVAGRQGDLALFYAWAGAVMIRDLSPRAARGDTGLRLEHLEDVRRWTAAWKRRARLPR